MERTVEDFHLGVGGHVVPGNLFASAVELALTPTEVEFRGDLERNCDGRVSFEAMAVLDHLAEDERIPDDTRALLQLLNWRLNGEGASWEPCQIDDTLHVVIDAIEARLEEVLDDEGAS